MTRQPAEHDLTRLKDTVAEIAQSRYPDATVLLSGSVVRGTATVTSDLDLVVIYAHLPAARRESFIHADWPVEAFLHDLQTLAYFFDEVDRPSGVPSLATMVTEGVVVQDNGGVAVAAKALAQSSLDRGPLGWTPEDRDNARYVITDLIADLRGCTATPERHAILSSLYPLLGTYWFRSQDQWAAKGKNLPRLMSAKAPDVSIRFDTAFESAFGQGDTAPVISLAADLLAPDGGFLFDGYSRTAPASWRRQP